jgi:hypothetical protein
VLLNLVPGILNVPGVPGSLFYRHPEYDQTWWWREFGRVSYLGGREYHKPQRLSIEFQYPRFQERNEDGVMVRNGTQTLNYQSLLFRHEREQDFEYENRKKRAYYYNYVRTIVNSLVSHATNRPATREGDDGLKEFWGAVDCERTTPMAKFMEQGLQQAQVQGIMWACVDVEPADRRNPYVYWVSPLDIFDWEMGEDGEIQWLKQFVYVEGKRGMWEAVKPMYRFRLWERDGVTTWETTPNGTGQRQIGPKQTYSLGKVPFVPLYSLRTDEKPFPDGVPLAIDLCKCANHIYNLTSLLSEILYKQTFSWLAVPDKNVDTLQMGLNTAFGYDPNGTSAVPTYLSPDPEQARVLMESINAAVEQSRQSVGVGRGRAEGSMSPTSGETAQLESADKRSILGDIASEAEDFERRLADMVLSYRAQKREVDVTIQYATDFDLMSLQDEINEALSMVKLSLPPEVMAEVKKNIVRRKFAAKPPKELEELAESVVVEEPPQVAPVIGKPADPDANDAQPKAGDKPKPGGEDEPGEADKAA